MRIHLIAAVMVLGLAWNLRVAAWQWGVLLLSISGVIVAEMLNTAVEYTVDLVSPAYSDLARAAKDIAAGAVLFSALGAIAIANLVFAPYFPGLIPGLWQQARDLPVLVIVPAAVLGIWLLWSAQPGLMPVALLAISMQLWLLYLYPDMRVASAIAVATFLAGVTGWSMNPIRFYMGVLLLTAPITWLITLGR